VKDPATRLVSCTWMLNCWLGVRSSPGPGNRTMAETMLLLEGISPMTTPLQEPPVA
jgi:hypothetical protein